VLKGEALQAYVNKAVRQPADGKAEDPFGAVATDLKTGQPILFRRGNTGMAVRASSAVPSVFQPVSIAGRPMSTAAWWRRCRCASPRRWARNSSSPSTSRAPPRPRPRPATLDVLMQTFTIMGQRLNHFELKDADIVITPALGTMGSADFNGRNLAMLAGEQAAPRHAAAQGQAQGQAADPAGPAT
jgi:NTE family protein